VATKHHRPGKAVMANAKVFGHDRSPILSTSVRGWLPRHTRRHDFLFGKLIDYFDRHLAPMPDAESNNGSTH
jgi:hypothetical protein